MLHSYSRQKGYQNFDGLGWILIVHTNMDEILRDVNSQRDNLILITIAMTSIAAVLGMFFARIFYRQSNKINENQKMITIGQLSSNIAHDMRNPLGAIRSSTERIKHHNKGQNEVIVDELNRINRAVKRMSHQIEGVLNYVRTTPLITDEHSILEMLNYAEDSLQIPKNVKLNLPDADSKIECDKEKIEISFVNLILNAIQAIGQEKEGTINIRIKSEENKVKIEFENSGQKIPEDVLPKIFDPLFTTRLKGTGLGLSSCKNIIEQHHGTISVTSRVPVIFTVMLPKSQNQA